MTHAPTLAPSETTFAPLRVAVFGATGSVGRLALRRLLAEGHEVAAFARRPETLTTDPAARAAIEAGRLRLIAGDALDPAAVHDALAGQDAAIVALGAGAGAGDGVRSVGTLNVIRAMQAHGVRRLVVQSTLGALDSRGALNFFWKRIMFGLLLRAAYRDHELQERIVQASGLDWTLVRPGAFTDGPEGGAYEVGFGAEARGLALKISRADVAAFLAAQLGDRRWIGRAVAISA